jgi:hypothetical protein
MAMCPLIDSSLHPQMWMEASLRLTGKIVIHNVMLQHATIEAHTEMV